MYRNVRVVQSIEIQSIQTKINQTKQTISLIMELFDVALFDNDFYKMIFRFGINISFLTLIIRYLYYKNARNKEYFFTYYMIGVIVFFLCYLEKI